MLTSTSIASLLILRYSSRGMDGAEFSGGQMKATCWSVRSARVMSCVVTSCRSGVNWRKCRMRLASCSRIEISSIICVVSPTSRRTIVDMVPPSGWLQFSLTCCSPSEPCQGPHIHFKSARVALGEFVVFVIFVMGVTLPRLLY